MNKTEGTGEEMMIAIPDYDGSVWIEGVKAEPFCISLALNDEYRAYESFPVEEMNGKFTVVFPFGRYYIHGI